MKIKPGLVLKVRFADVNHYVQIVNVKQGSAGVLEIQILCGKTVGICKHPETGWLYENPVCALDDGLLEKIGAAIDRCQPL